MEAAPISEPPSRLAGSPGEIHVWLVPIEAEDDGHPELTGLLTPIERERAHATPSEGFRRRFVHSRAALRELLSRYLSLPPAEIAMEAGPRGRPALAPPVGGLDFNLSHAGPWAAIAFGWGRRVGIDIEPRERRIAWRSVAPRSFSPRERGRLDLEGEEGAMRAFLRGWLRKEAYTKARGEGFAYGFADFSVSLDDPIEGRGLLDDRKDPTAVDRWWIRDLALEPSLAGAIAYDGPPARIRCWRYQPRTNLKTRPVEVG